jgi:hypothetical protein
MSYLEDFNRSVQASMQQETSELSTFFDTGKSEQERLAAFNQAGSFHLPEDIARALAVYRNAAEDDTIQAAALRGLVQEVGQDEALMDEAIGLLRDPSAPEELRHAALYVLQVNSFSSPLFLTKQPDFNQALRSLVDAPDSALKNVALEYLAQHKDEYLQRRLIEGLRDPSRQITEPELAIQLLSYDLHAEHFPLLRRIAAAPPNAASKKEALRNLAADPQARELLVQVLKDETENPEIRHVSATALQLQSPQEAEKLTKELVLRQQEDEEFKTALLNTLLHTAGPGVLEKDKAFNTRLKAVGQTTHSPQFKKVYAQYQAERTNTPHFSLLSVLYLLTGLLLSLATGLYRAVSSVLHAGKAKTPAEAERTGVSANPD